MSAIDCSDFRKFLDPYLDGEFADRERADFDAHLALCPDCRTHFEQRSWFLRAVKPALKRPERMPAEAHQRLTARLRTARRPDRARQMLRRLALPVPALAAAGMVALLVTPLTGFAPVVVGDAVDYHCQELPVEALPGPEASEIDQWFDGKLPFRLAAPRFQDGRVQLLGGRLSRVGGHDGRQSARRAAYLIYGVGAHKLSVLVFDGSGLDLVDGGATRRIKGHRLAVHDADGYRVALYQKGSLGYAVTSDLPESDMLNLIATSL